MLRSSCKFDRGSKQFPIRPWDGSLPSSTCSELQAPIWKLAYNGVILGLSEGPYQGYHREAILGSNTPMV